MKRFRQKAVTVLGEPTVFATDGRDGRGTSRLDLVLDLDAPLSALGEHPTAPIGETP